MDFSEVLCRIDIKNGGGGRTTYHLELEFLTHKLTLPPFSMDFKQAHTVKS